MLFCLFFIVGDGAPDVPLIDVSVSISFVFFYTMFGAKIYNIVCFFSFVTNPSLAASMSGCRGRQPLHICVYSLSAAKSLSLFADFTLYKKLQKRCRDLFSDTALFCFLQLHYIFFRRRKCVCTVCRCCYYLPERCSTDISCHKKTLCSGDPVLASFHISAFVKLANAL